VVTAATDCWYKYDFLQWEDNYWVYFTWGIY